MTIIINFYFLNIKKQRTKTSIHISNPAIKIDLHLSIQLPILFFWIIHKNKTKSRWVALLKHQSKAN